MPSDFTFDDFQLNVDPLELRRGGEPIPADTVVLRVLATFVRRPGELITKQDLVDDVWCGKEVSENAVSVAMTRLRKTLGEPRGQCEAVKTVYGRGYRFVRPVTVGKSRLSRAAAKSEQAKREPFVGRVPVLAALSSALHGARGGRGTLAIITGEAGLGKTRIAEMVALEAAALGIPVAWGDCHELKETPPLWPFAQLVRELLAKLPETWHDARFAMLRPALARLLPELDADSGPDPGDIQPRHKHRLFDAVMRLFELAAERSGWLFVLDDLHRADADSSELLEYLLARIPRTRIMVLATLRHVDGRRPHAYALSRVLAHRNTTCVALPPLNEAQVAQYVTALFGEPDPELSRVVFQKSDGNPFFMTQLARALRLTERHDPLALSIPQPALELVRQRLAVLDAAGRCALGCAAVIGRSFNLALLQSVAGRDAASLIVSLDAAISSGLITARPDSPTEFVFTHELLRQALHDDLSPSERRRLHLGVARALEDRLAAGDAVAPADLAYHYRSALPEADPRKAVQYCIAAAKAAAHVCAYADGERYLREARRALDLVSDASPRLRVRLLLNQALFARAYSERAFQPLIREVIRVAREQRDGDNLARSALLLDPYPGFPPMPGSRTALEQALEILPANGPMRAAVLAQLAVTAPLAWRAADSSKQLDEALALARTSPELLDIYSALGAQLYARGGPGQRRLATDLLLELDDLCRQHPGALTVPPVLLDVHRALAALQDGNLASSTLALDRCEARCRELDSELLWQVQRFQLLSRVNLGPATKAELALRKHHEQSLQRSISGTALFCAYDQSVVLREVWGERVSDAWRRAVAPAEEDTPSLWAMKLRALSCCGDDEAALRLLRTLPAHRLCELPRDRDYLGTLGALARAALALGALDYAEAIYDLMAPYPTQFAVNISFFCEGSVSGLLGMLARALGRRSVAAGHLELAVAASERAGFMSSAAEARIELALCASTL